MKSRQCKQLKPLTFLIALDFAKVFSLPFMYKLQFLRLLLASHFLFNSQNVYSAQYISHLLILIALESVEQKFHFLNPKCVMFTLSNHIQCTYTYSIKKNIGIPQFPFPKYFRKHSFAIISNITFPLSMLVPNIKLTCFFSSFIIADNFLKTSRCLTLGNLRLQLLSQILLSPILVI